MPKRTSPWPAHVDRSESIVLFDGVCHLCNGLVQFIVRQDSEAWLRLAALQSPGGQALLRWAGRPLDDFDTIVFVQRGQAYLKSTAVLRIVGGLPWPWPLLSLAIAVPPFIRDWVYDCVAQHRYRLFGREETCMMPSPDLARRFLT